jgi:hypothetical protein
MVFAVKTVFAEYAGRGARPAGSSQWRQALFGARREVRAALAAARTAAVI